MHFKFIGYGISGIKEFGAWNTREQREERSTVDAVGNGEIREFSVDLLPRQIVNVKVEKRCLIIKEGLCVRKKGRSIQASNGDRGLVNQGRLAWKE